MKLHEETNVEMNDYGNNLSDIETFAKHLEIDINIIDAEQFNSIVYTANKGALRITLKIDPRMRVKWISFVILSRSA